MRSTSGSKLEDQRLCLWCLVHWELDPHSGVTAGANVSSLPVRGDWHTWAMQAARMQGMQNPHAGAPRCKLWAVCAQPQAQSCLCSSKLNCIATPRKCHSSKKAGFAAEESFCLWGTPNVTSSNARSSLCVSMFW